MISSVNGKPVYDTLKEAGVSRPNKQSKIIMYNEYKLYECPSGYIVLCNTEGCLLKAKKNSVKCGKHSEEIVSCTYNGYPVKTCNYLANGNTPLLSLVINYRGLRLLFQGDKYIVLCSNQGCSNIGTSSNLGGELTSLTTVYFNQQCNKHKLSKADYIKIAMERKVLKTHGELHALSISSLKDLLGELSEYEKCTPSRRPEYNGDINYNSHLYGIPVSYTKEMKIDCLYNLPICNRIILNEEQQYIARKISESNIVVGAGPGSGKTATLVDIVNQLCGLKVLVLMYGVNVECQFKRRLTALGTKITPKRTISNPTGTYVVTLHKYAYHSRNGDIPQGTTTGSCFVDGYDEYIQRVINIPARNTEQWDYVIIDEAQDLKDMYYKMIQTIRTKHTIYMGDGRQQINTGANIYNTIMDSSEYLYKLSHNHRSTHEIVEILNKFSSTNFSPNVHIPQISKIKDPNSLVIVRGNQAALVAQYVKDYPSGSTYVISPVTYDRYNIGQSTNEIRQLLYNDGRIIYPSESGRELDPTCDYITNSKTIKGLERDQVILYGVSNTQVYKDYNIPEYELKCLIYVALSRARKRLVIVIDDNTYHSPNLLDSCLSGYISMQSNYYSENTIQNYKGNKPFSISVTDLATYDFSPKLTHVAELPNVVFSREGIEDCSGLYVEACIASTLGVLQSNYNYIISESSSDMMSYLDINTYICKIRALENDILRDIFVDINNSTDRPEYKYVRAMYVAKIAADWTVSQSLRDIIINVTPYSDFITNFKEKVHHSSRLNYNVLIDRSDKIGGIINGVTDFRSKNNIFEIKHAHNNKKHHNQTVIYKQMVSDDSCQAFLINTLEGTVNLVEPSLPSTIDTFAHYVRSILVLRQAHMSRVGLQSLDMHNGIIISVDTEFFDGNIYEIGAVAFDTINCKILGTYQKTVGCTSFDLSRHSIPIGTDISFTRLTGLKILSTPCFPQDYKDFYTWIDNWPHCKFIQWGSGDSKLLSLDNSRFIDVSMKFRLYRQLISTQFNHIKSGYRLCDAVTSIFPPNTIWEPHRAFEDAVLTMGVYYSLLVPR
jgi:hypothetical protein